MYELVKLTESTYYIKSAVNIGLIKLNEHQVCLIDSGIDKEVGRKIRQILDKNNWELVAIYNTHSHADHIGGNKYLQDQKKCKIYASEIETFFVQNPCFEPTLLNAGVPFKEQKGKFLMAQPSQCEVLTNENLAKNLEILPLPGHCYNMVGFKTADNVAFIADSLCSALTLDKYQISYVFNVQLYLQTLESLKDLKADFFVASHVEVCDDIKDLIELNIQKVHEIGDKIVELCADAIGFEELLEKIFVFYKLSMNQVQYLLISSTLRAYLTWLKQSDRVVVEFECSKMLWKKA